MISLKELLAARQKQIAKLRRKLYGRVKQNGDTVIQITLSKSMVDRLILNKDGTIGSGTLRDQIIMACFLMVDDSEAA